MGFFDFLKPKKKVEKKKVEKKKVEKKKAEKNTNSLTGTISKAKFKRFVNKTVFEEFMSTNSHHFNIPTPTGHYKDDEYCSKGGCIKLHYFNKHPERIPPFTIGIKIYNNDIQNWESYGPHNIITGNFRINSNDKKLFTEVKKIKSIHRRVSKILPENMKNWKQKEKERKIRLEDEEKKRLDKLNKEVFTLLKELDKDNNGVIDIIEEDPFKKLLQKHQKKIITIDKSYIQHFVKISSFLNDKKTNIQTTFKSLNKVSNLKELQTFVKILKNQKHSYNVILFHSISMITSLTKEEQDLITFYEIYEHFDKLKIFKSEHEKEVSNELKQLNFKTSQVINKLGDLMYRINRFENSMIDSLNELTYTTENSFNDLRTSMSTELNSINSSIGLNNLLTGIQTYQMYKINMNTKSLN